MGFGCLEFLGHKSKIIIHLHVYIHRFDFIHYMPKQIAVAKEIAQHKNCGLDSTFAYINMCTLHTNFNALDSS